MAKAVRIRIRSGNEEHTSLDSLIKNFDIKDILELIDGRKENGKYIESRLERWLKQIHENDKVMKIHNINLSKDKIYVCLDLIKIFFREFSSASDIHQVAEKWINNSSSINNGRNLYRYLARLGDTKSINYLFNNNILPNIISEEDGEKDTTGEIEYYLGICYIDGKSVIKNYEKGYELISKSSKKNNLLAKEYLKKIVTKPKSSIIVQGKPSNNIDNLDSYLRLLSKQKYLTPRDIEMWIVNFNNWSYDDYNNINKVKENSNLTTLMALKQIIDIRSKNYDNNLKLLSKIGCIYNYDQPIIFIKAINNYFFKNYGDKEKEFETFLLGTKDKYVPSSYLCFKKYPLKNYRIEFKNKFKILSESKFEKMDFFDKVSFIVSHFLDLRP